MPFPPGFLWGAATSAHQVEGGNRNDWTEWEQTSGRIRNGHTSGDAAEWWSGRAEQDLRLAQAMGHNAHRLSLEWSRLEPRPGEYDDVAFERYRRILGTMRELRLASCVTVCHFTLPLWAAERGGWRNNELPARLARFAATCVERLSDLVDLWATINEPTILFYKAYIEGAWPPGGPASAAPRVLANLLRAHGAMSVAMRERRPDVRIGIVLNMPAFDGARANALDRAVARTQDRVFNGVVLRALLAGRLRPPLVLRAEDLPGGPNAADWYGLNYYGRHLMRFDVFRPILLFGKQVQHEIAGVSETWGDPFPEGLTRGLLRLAALGRPVYVTENGINDAGDELRPGFLAQHVRAVEDALGRGADVRGYFHWSLIDNFEWAEGWSARFGLVALDPTTQERRPRHSARVYSRLIGGALR